MNTDLAAYAAEKFTVNEQDLWGVEAEARPQLCTDISAYVPHEEVEWILNQRSCYNTEVRAVHNGICLDMNNFSSRRVLEKYRICLLFPRLEYRSTWLKSICTDIEHKASLNVFTVAFYTHVAKQTLDLHWDASAGVALQMTGRKRWWIWRPVVQTLEQMKHLRELTPEERASRFFLSVVLEPGDALFIPRGWPHCAATEGEEASFHITFGAIHHDLQQRFGA